METEKLYSPLNFFIRDKYDAAHGQYDDIDYWRDPMTHENAFVHMDDIELALRRDRDCMDSNMGLAEYVPESLDGVVISLFPDIEFHGGKLWCVADMRLARPITPGEMDELTQWWEGQLSDGWGEGFEQREIDVDTGTLYIEPWTADDDFHIYTQREFEQYAGMQSVTVETPAQAGLHEPDIFDDEKVAVLRDQLIGRLDENFRAYLGAVHSHDDWDVTGMSREIAAYAGAHYYLSEIHNFHTSELEYLLQFQNPLQVVANKFQTAGMNDHSDIMWEIFNSQDALQQDYELVTKITEQTALEAEDRLRARLAENYSDYKADMLSLSKEELFDAVSEAASTQQVYDYLTERHYFTNSEIDFLLKFENPLDVVSDRWDTQMADVGETISRIFQDEKWTTLQGGYALIPEEAPSHEPEPAGRTSTAEKPSVLEQIRKARDEAKNNPTPRKETPGKDNGPEL